MYCASSFNGVIEDIPDIHVDNFVNTNKKAYFLSHCHTDHTEGLYRYKLVNNMARNGAKIYMTEESMKIVRYTAELKENDEICDYIHTLKLGTTTVTIGDQHIEVTLIPAGHCIGSVMFLFRIPNKTILYTGDFRIRQNDVHKYLQLHDKKGDPIKIDVMYVDTTFIDDEHPEFAKRSDSVEEMLVKIDRWLKEDPNNRVALHTSAQYGYEFVFNKIYKRLGEKVSVNDGIWELYKHFPDLLPSLTKEEIDPKIHYCRPIKWKYDCEHNNTDKTFLSVLFSAMSWRNYDDETQSCEDSSPDTVKVCYATHCSRSELLYFVNYLHPVKVVGFPNPYNPRIKETRFTDSFSPSPKKKKNIEPKEEVTEHRKVDRNLLKEMFGL